MINTSKLAVIAVTAAVGFAVPAFRAIVLIPEHFARELWTQRPAVVL